MLESFLLERFFMINSIHGSQPQLPISDTAHESSKVKQPKQESRLSEVWDKIRKNGIRLTRLLPFSARGLVLNIVRTPIRLLQSVGLGFAEMVKQKKVKAFGSTFLKEMSTYMDKDWRGGISDSYTDLRSPANKEVGRQVARENLRYASYMYNGYQLRQDDPRYESISASGRSLPNELHLPIDPGVKDKFESLDKAFREKGFEQDAEGNYFHRETGNMFNFVYDSDKEEFIVCFWGLGNEANLDLSHKGETEAAEIRSKIGRASLKTIALEFIGGIEDSALQAMEIGKILKDVTKGSSITPVVIGHSHGGGLAQCAAADNGLKAVVFNPRPMGASMRHLIGQSKVAKNAKNIIAFSGEGDFLTSNRFINALAIAFERLTGIPVPRSIGQGFKLPKAPAPLQKRLPIINNAGLMQGILKALLIH